MKNYAGFVKAGRWYPIVSRRESRQSAVGRGISKMSWRHRHDPGWGFFGFNVMFRPPLGILPSFFTNFQVPDVLHRGGHMPPSPHRRSVGLEPIGDRVKRHQSSSCTTAYSSSLIIMSEVKKLNWFMQIIFAITLYNIHRDHETILP